MKLRLYSRSSANRTVIKAFGNSATILANGFSGLIQPNGTIVSITLAALSCSECTWRLPLLRPPLPAVPTTGPALTCPPPQSPIGAFYTIDAVGACLPLPVLFTRRW
jgi:hypothetical protein